MRDPHEVLVLDGRGVAGPVTADAFAAARPARPRPRPASSWATSR
ncbi:MAG: hypothetical protein ABSA02_29290 [Trebonia sp.]